MVIEEKSSLIENIAVGAALVVVFLGTLSIPRLSTTISRAELNQDGARKAQRITSLEASLATAENESENLRGQLAQAGSQLEATAAALETAHSEISGLKVERDELATRVTATTQQLRDVDSQLEDLKQKLAEFKEFVTAQQVANERDEAVERAKKAEERIRELTLQLNRAGIWP